MWRQNTSVYELTPGRYERRLWIDSAMLDHGGNRLLARLLRTFKRATPRTAHGSPGLTTIRSNPTIVRAFESLGRR